MLVYDERELHIVLYVYSLELSTDINRPFFSRIKYCFIMINMINIESDVILFVYFIFTAVLIVI